MKAKLEAFVKDLEGRYQRLHGVRAAYEKVGVDFNVDHTRTILELQERAVFFLAILSELREILQYTEQEKLKTMDCAGCSSPTGGPCRQHANVMCPSTTLTCSQVDEAQS